MTPEMFRDVLAWCTVMDFGLLLLWFMVFSLAHDWLYNVHSKWFTISAGHFDAIHYAGMAFFKLGIFLFNLVPYFALRIVG